MWAKLPIRAALSIAIGLMIGAICRRVVVRSELATILTAALYSVVAIGLVESYPEGVVARVVSGGTARGSLWLTLAYEAAIAVTVPLALVVRRK